jgi:hypothetical protein
VNEWVTESLSNEDHILKVTGLAQIKEENMKKYLLETMNALAGLVNFNPFPVPDRAQSFSDTRLTFTIRPYEKAKNYKARRVNSRAEKRSFVGITDISKLKFNSSDFLDQPKKAISWRFDEPIEVVLVGKEIDKKLAGVFGDAVDYWNRLFGRNILQLSRSEKWPQDSFRKIHAIFNLKGEHISIPGNVQWDLVHPTGEIVAAS